MKTTLKTRPDFIHLIAKGISCETCLAKADEWFEDFEAELRELFKEKSCPVCWRVEYLKKEILGESYG